MLDSYTEWLSLDRIDNNWNYCKDNCRWVSMKEQWVNRRNNLIYKWKSISQWVELLWFTRHTFDNKYYKSNKTQEDINNIMIDIIKSLSELNR